MSFLGWEDAPSAFEEQNFDAKGREGVPSAQPLALVFSRPSSPASPLDLEGLSGLLCPSPTGGLGLQRGMFSWKEVSEPTNSKGVLGGEEAFSHEKRQGWKPVSSLGRGIELTESPFLPAGPLQRPPSGPCPPLPICPLFNPQEEGAISLDGDSSVLPPSPKGFSECLIPAAQVTPQTPSGTLGSQLTGLSLHLPQGLGVFSIGMSPIVPVGPRVLPVPPTPKPECRGRKNTGFKAPQGKVSHADLPPIVAPVKRASPTIFQSINPQVGRVLQFFLPEEGEARLHGLLDPRDNAWSVDAERRTASFRRQRRRAERGDDVGTGLGDDPDSL